jgi:hypothetical protein
MGNSPLLKMKIELHQKVTDPLILMKKLISKAQKKQDIPKSEKLFLSFNLENIINHYSLTTFAQN